MMIEYSISKNFDIDISFEDLISYNKTCKINLNAKRNFESFNGILIYVSHPKGTEKFSIQLGVNRDGFTYEGDYGCDNSYKEIPIEDGLKILNIYREIFNQSFELVNLFLNNKLDKDNVEINLK